VVENCDRFQFFTCPIAQLNRRLTMMDNSHTQQCRRDGKTDFYSSPPVSSLLDMCRGCITFLYDYRLALSTSFCVLVIPVAVVVSHPPLLYLVGVVISFFFLLNVVFLISHSFFSFDFLISKDESLSAAGVLESRDPPFLPWV
jgi:hypothetical protein